MNKFDAIITEYKKLNFNNSESLIHSIDKDKYTNLCKNFFMDKNNLNLFSNIANDANVSSNESERVFVDWLLEG